MKDRTPDFRVQPDEVTRMRGRGGFGRFSFRADAVEPRIRGQVGAAGSAARSYRDSRAGESPPSTVYRTPRPRPQAIVQTIFRAGDTGGTPRYSNAQNA